MISYGTIIAIFDWKINWEVISFRLMLMYDWICYSYIFNLFSEVLILYYLKFCINYSNSFSLNI